MNEAEDTRGREEPSAPGSAKPVTRVSQWGEAEGARRLAKTWEGRSGHRRWSNERHRLSLILRQNLLKPLKQGGHPFTADAAIVILTRGLVRPPLKIGSRLGHLLSRVLPSGGSARP